VLRAFALQRRFKLGSGMGFLFLSFFSLTYGSNAKRPERPERPERPNMIFLTFLSLGPKDQKDTPL
jgi:hypothetical protein